MGDHCELSGDKCKVLDVMPLSRQPRDNRVVRLLRTRFGQARGLNDLEIPTCEEKDVDNRS
jgi:hypothetical protein